ncbi:MAG TPA: hypothetical protein DCE41_13895, partial [Cytophagales bacterium]|nr:hypothetical protein [Cytophagales bacterium]
WASTNGVALEDNTATLNRTDWTADLGYVRFDQTLDETAVETLIDDLTFDPNGTANALVLSWTGPTAATETTLFTNIYRDNNLIAIVNGTTQYTDRTATEGSHIYALKSYYHAADGSTVYVQSTGEQSASVPSILFATDLMAKGNAEGVVDITWTYPTDAEVASFTVSHTRTEAATGETITHTVGTIAHQTTSNSYTLADVFGVPGETYTYTLTAETVAGESVVMDTEDEPYPALLVSDFLSSMDVYEESDHALVELGYIEGLTQQPNWDGFALVTETGDTLAASKTAALPLAETDFVYWRHGLTSATTGTLQTLVYKHTDEGTYFTNTSLSSTYMVAEAYAPYMPAAPTAPSLATNDPTVQAPTLSASKDAKGQIFVAWEYPDYTEVTFQLSHRNANTTDAWETVTLPNEQRAWLDTQSSMQLREYKLVAMYSDGAKSTEVWDYGLQRQYQVLEGYLRDADQFPLVNALISVGGYRTLTDSAGYYRIDDMELAPGAYSVKAYPNTTIAATASATLTIVADQQTYQQDFTNSYSDFIFAKGTQATVPTVQGYSDASHLTNQLRWTLTNDRYTGVKVYLGSTQNEVADLRQGEAMEYADSLVSNNAGSAQYYVRPYLINALGEYEYQDAGGATLANLEYAPLMAPAYADAFSNQAEGTVEVRWAHTRNNVDGYVILRNDVEIGRVLAEETAAFTDDYGLPGTLYRYSIHTYLARNGEEIQSALPITVEALYPAPGNVINPSVSTVLVEDSTEPENAIQLNWEYPTNSALDGVIIYRGLEPLATVTTEDTQFLDYTGVPETYKAYTLVSYDERGGQLYEASGTSINAVFPRLQTPTLDPLAQSDFDNLTATWHYPQQGVDGFMFQIINTTTNETVVEEEIAHTQTDYNYTFGEGISDHDYTVAVRAYADRNGQRYYSDKAQQAITHLTLPAPTLVALDYTLGETTATLTWDMSTERMEGFTLDITLEGVTRASLDLPANQRSYTFAEDFSYLQGLTDSKGTVSFLLTAHQNTAGGTATTLSPNPSEVMELLDGAYYVQDFSATTNLSQTVNISWNAPSTLNTVLEYRLMRDGELVEELAGDITSTQDPNAYPGINHQYQLMAVYDDGNGGEDTYTANTTGSILGNGIIDGQVMTELHTPVAGVSLVIEAVIQGVPFSTTLTADEEGTYATSAELPNTPDGIEYTIRPADNPEYYEPQFTTVTLTTTGSARTSEQLTHILSRSLAGTVTNPYAPGGLGRENVEVTLWGYPEPEAGQTNTATDPTRLDTQKTDSEGKFEFELPYFLTGYTDYELEILAVPTDNAGEDASPFGFLYDTPEGLTATVDDDSTLWVTLPALDLEATDAYTLTIEDTVNHPVQVVVTGPGEEDVFGGYEFTLRIREVGGMVDYFVETVDRQIKEVLPPLEYQVSVVDVNKRDAFSMAVLDYFRSRVLTVDNQEEHLNVLRAQREATTYETETHYLRYNERTAVAITGMESVLQTCNDEKLYVMTASPSNEDDANYALMVTVSPTQTINGNPVDVTSGFMVAKFSGGYLYDRADNADTQAATYLNDTLDFEDGIWESLVIVPKTPNLVFPYKQLLEVYYYDENSNYQGSAQREILVTGQNALPGADVFVLDDESTKVPLYVLRDPPGDQSYSYVNKGSALNVNLQRRMESTMDNALGLELKGEIGWLKTQYNLKAYYNRSSNTTLGESFTLDFTENISTAGAASSSENIEGYLDGPEADVIVGMDLILAYSMTEVLSFESCSPKKTRELSVSPNRIKTMWAYTRSQIENSIRYYKEVAEGNTYEVTVSGGGSADEVIEDIGLAADAFEKVLQEVDTKYTPLCEMCEFIQDFDFDGDYYLSLWESLKNALDIDMYGYVEDIRNFCKQGSYYENNSCSTKPLTELMVEWDQSYRDAYETAYRKYLAIREIERLFNRYGPHPDDYAADVMHSLNDKLSFYEPIENITFSAGSKVTRTSTSGAQSTSGLGHTGTIGISTITKVGYKNSLDVDFWFGVGAGTKVGGSDLAFEISGIIETTVKHQGTYSLNEGASTSFTTGYVLDDNDEGDHFSVDVLQGGEWGETSLSNYFSLMGGRSSCPYEKGTFPRDMPTLQIMDTDG